MYFADEKEKKEKKKRFFTDNVGILCFVYTRPRVHVTHKNIGRSSQLGLYCSNVHVTHQNIGRSSQLGL
jgi:hypothetical protein